MYFSFLLYYPLVHWSCDHLFMTYIVFIYIYIYIYMMMMIYVSSHISPCVVSFLSLYTCFFMYTIFIYVSH